MRRRKVTPKTITTPLGSMTCERSRHRPREAHAAFGQIHRWRGQLADAARHIVGKSDHRSRRSQDNGNLASRRQLRSTQNDRSSPRNDAIGRTFAGRNCPIRSAGMTRCSTSSSQTPLDEISARQSTTISDGTPFATTSCENTACSSLRESSANPWRSRMPILNRARTLHGRRRNRLRQSVS